MKYFLLIAGSSYYPDRGTGDWLGCYSTKEEIEKMIQPIPHHTYFSKGKHKGEIKDTWYEYKIGESKYDIYDWYDIIDLRTWIN